MLRKTGVIIFTHGSRLPAGNAIMLRLVEQVRARLGDVPLEAAFMELGKPPIPVAIRKLLRRGCNHIFGYALFLVPGSHLQEDIPFIFRETLKKHPGVTWEISPALLHDPLLVEFVAQHVTAALAPPPAQ